MAKRAKVGLDIVDPTDPFHWLAVRGHVTEITEEGADVHIGDGEEIFEPGHVWFHQPGDVRVICKIQPDVVNYQTSPRTVDTFRK